MPQRGEPAGSPPPPPPELPEVLSAEQSLDDLLQLVVNLTRRAVPGVDGATITLQRDGQLLTSNFSDEVVRELDGVQYQNNAGPCVDAVRSGATTRMTIDGDHREYYQTFVDAARSRFITAVLSTPLSVKGQVVGGLNLYSGSADQFGDDEVELAAMFAGQASVVLVSAMAFRRATTENDTLQEALVNRELIGMAKGILMGTTGCSSEEAFALLRTRSQHQNRKVRLVAQDVVASMTGGTTPPRFPAGAPRGSTSGRSMLGRRRSRPN